MKITEEQINKMIKEIGTPKHIPGFSKYIVFPNGEICSIPRTVKRKNGTVFNIGYMKLSQNETGFGYKTVCLYNEESKRVYIFVHKAVLIAYKGIVPGKTQGNHINGIKSDNHITNLEWVNQSENTKHAYRTGLAKPNFGEKNQNSKLSNKSRIEIISSNKKTKELADQYGVSPRLIRHIRQQEVSEMIKRLGGEG